MKIFKSREVKTPTRGTSQSAGLDFYIPKDASIPTYLCPQDAVNIPSGIHVNIPKGFVLVGFNKSGVALKGLQIGACVVDEDYQGEIHLHLVNVSSRHIKLAPGDKIAQFLLLPIEYCNIEETKDLEDLYKGKVTERGAGAFGSTGTK